jgi:hypothetical protein
MESPAVFDANASLMPSKARSFSLRPAATTS